MRILILYEPQHDKTNKMTCAPSEDSESSLCAYDQLRTQCFFMRTDIRRDEKKTSNYEQEWDFGESLRASEDMERW